MQLSEIINLLNYLESTYDVTRWEINSIKIWPLLRLQIGKKLQRRIIPTETEKDFKFKNPGKAGVIWGLVLEAIRNRTFISKRIDVIVFSNHFSEIKIPGGIYNRNIDPIIEELSASRYKTMIIRKGFQEEYSKLDQPYPQGFNVTYHEKWYKLKIRLLQKFVFYRPRVIVNTEYFNMLDYLKEKYSITVDSLESSVLLIEQFRLFFDKLIEKISPAYFICTNYSTSSCLGALYACNSKGIPTFDVQHGVQGEAHVAYSNWSNIPDEGYPLLPRNYFVWSGAEVRSFNRWGVSKGYRAYATGNLFLEKWKNDKDWLVVHYKNFFDKLKLEKGVDKSLLYCMSNELPPVFIFDFVRSNKEYSLFIRMHPKRTYMRDDVLLLADKMNVQVYLDEVAEVPLHALLINIDIIVTSYSSVTLEAIDLNKKPIVIHPMGKDYFKEQIDSKKCNYSEDPEKFSEMIDDSANGLSQASYPKMSITQILLEINESQYQP